jgi:hypothetical protein
MYGNYKGDFARPKVFQKLPKIPFFDIDNSISLSFEKCYTETNKAGNVSRQPGWENQLNIIGKKAVIIIINA